MLQLLASVLALTTAAVGLTDRELDDAQKGLIPTRTEAFDNDRGQSAGRGLGAIVIERPLDEVWTTLCRYEDRAEYIPRVKKVAVLAREGNRLRVRQEIDATVKTIRYTAWYELDAADHTIRWKIDRSANDNSLRYVDGEYHMVELQPGRTLLVYRSYVDSGFLIARSIQNYVARRSIPELMRSIKRRVESGGQWLR